MKTLLVDGEWNLKRNFFKRKNMLTTSGYNCGGSFGFIDSLRSVLNKIIPDRVVVCWDGFHSGKLRYDIYPPYKANRNKKWEIEDKAIAMQGIGSEEDKEKVEILRQKVQLKNLLEELYVRQVEVDLIEADDLIAEYIRLKSDKDDEQIFIFSKDDDFLQLINDNVFLVSTGQDFFIFNKMQYERKFGHTLENELLFKCFEGCHSDCIKGVGGITRKTLLKYFPSMAKEKYMLKRLMDEAEEHLKIKDLKVFHKILGAQEILYRNAKLMDLKRPFLNEEAKKNVNIIKFGVLSKERNVAQAMTSFLKEGMDELIRHNRDDFFAPFYRIMMKEKEYEQKMKI